MKITVNGETKDFTQNITVSQMLDLLELDTRKIAVERNFEIVPKSTYNNVTLEDGDRLEIVAFIGGG